MYFPTFVYNLLSLAHIYIYISFAPLSWAENWCCKMFTSTWQVHTMSTQLGCVWMYSAEVPSQIHMTCAVILLHEYSVHLAYCEFCSSSHGILQKVCCWLCNWLNSTTKTYVPSVTLIPFCGQQHSIYIHVWVWLKSPQRRLRPKYNVWDIFTRCNMDICCIV